MWQPPYLMYITVSDNGHNIVCPAINTELLLWILIIGFLLLHWREIAVNRVNIWSHSYSGSYPKQPKNINKPVELLVLKLWLGFGHFISPLPLWESYVPPIYPFCPGITQAPAFYPNMHTLSFHGPGETLSMPLCCFINTTVIPINPFSLLDGGEGKNCCFGFCFCCSSALMS